MNKQDSNAYALAFKKLFSKIQADNPHYSVGETLLGLVVDWSDAQIKGLATICYWKRKGRATTERVQSSLATILPASC